MKSDFEITEISRNYTPPLLNINRLLIMKRGKTFLSVPEEARDFVQDVLLIHSDFKLYVYLDMEYSKEPTMRNWHGYRVIFVCQWCTH